MGVGKGKGRECLAGQGGRACFVSFREGQRLQCARCGTASNSTGGLVYALGRQSCWRWCSKPSAGGDQAWASSYHITGAGERVSACTAK